MLSISIVGNESDANCSWRPEILMIRIGNAALPALPNHRFTTPMKVNLK